MTSVTHRDQHDTPPAYCSGYRGAHGEWNTGFDCPPGWRCCVHPDRRFCCKEDNIQGRQVGNTTAATDTFDLVSSEHLVVQICAIVSVCVLFSTLTAGLLCLYWRVCPGYKRRHPPGALLTTSSAARRSSDTVCEYRPARARCVPVPLVPPPGVAVSPQGDITRDTTPVSHHVSGLPPYTDINTPSSCTAPCPYGEAPPPYPGPPHTFIRPHHHLARLLPPHR